MLWSSPSDWHKFEVAPLGVDMSGWDMAPFREDPSPFELISVGLLVEIKGYPLLLEAVACLRREGRNVRLTWWAMDRTVAAWKNRTGDLELQSGFGLPDGGLKENYVSSIWQAMSECYPASPKMSQWS